MEKLFKIISMSALAAASFLLVLIYTSTRQIKKTEYKFTNSISIAVYLEDEASSDSIKEIREFIDNNEILTTKRFRDSKTIYNDLSKNSRLAEQIQIVGEDFIFPPTFIVGVQDIDIDGIDRAVENIENMAQVEHVDYPYRTVVQAKNFLNKARKFYKIVVSLSVIFALFLYFLSGYIQAAAEKNEYHLLIMFKGNLSKKIYAGIVNRSFYGFSLTLLSISLVYVLFMDIININFYSIKVAVVLGLISSLLVSLFYFYFVKRHLKQKS